jgi:propanediol dehydratase small subunit
MNPLYLLLGAVVALGAVATSVAERHRFRRLWSRDCTGKDWKAAFPEASKSEIREFLDLFVRAFAFSKSRRLKFEPTDRVMEIYGTRYPRYPSSLSADMMELETFARMTEKRYGLDLAPGWSPETTLGEIFERVRGRVA